MATLEVNALNVEGMTAVDVLIRSRRDVRDLEIEKALKHAGGYGTLETNIPLSMNQTMANRSLQKKGWERLLKQQDDWLERKRSALMVVASLIATMAFQVGVNPPRGVWQDDKLVDSQSNPVSDPHLAGFSILAYHNPIGYARFYIVNMTGFIASLSIILLLMSGLPLKRRLFMWILMVITWIAITAIALTYVISIALVTPYEVQNSLLSVMGFSVLLWLGLMALLLIGHTIRLIVKLVKKMRKRLRRRRLVSDSTVHENNVAL